MVETFGPYELIARIGMGGMAEVFLARRREAAGFVKDVVIKRILPAYSQDEDFVNMFHDEARLAATLRHANIVQVTSFGEVKGQWFIELELIEGADLARLMRYARAARRPVGANRAVQIVMAAARGLAYAHERTDGGQKLQIVHRDISPANIMVSVHGDVKVMDFGIAKALARATRTNTGVVKGKQSYMAPEHAIGQAEQRSDIFELGICLWEMIADRRLYVADAAHLYIEMARRAEIPSIREVAPDTHPELAQVVMRALMREVEDRYQTMRELERDLNQVLFKMGGAIAAPLDEWVHAILPSADLKLLQGEVVEPPSMPAPDGSTSIPAVSVTHTAATAALGPKSTTPSVNPDAATGSVSAPMRDIGATLAADLSDTRRYVFEDNPAKRKGRVPLLFAFGIALLALGIPLTLLRQAPVTQPAVTSVAVEAPQPASLPEPAPPPVADPAASKPIEANAIEAKPAPTKPKATLAAKTMALPAAPKEALAHISLRYCPMGSKLIDRKKVLATLTQTNWAYLPVPSGTRTFEVELPDKTRVTLPKTVIAPDSDDVHLECPRD